METTYKEGQEPPKLENIDLQMKGLVPVEPLTNYSKRDRIVLLLLLAYSSILTGYLIFQNLFL